MRELPGAGVTRSQGTLGQVLGLDLIEATESSGRPSSDALRTPRAVTHRAHPGP